MINQLLAVWMSILGALAGIIISLRVSLYFLINDADERKKEMDSKVKQALKPYNEILSDLNSNSSIPEGSDSCLAYNNYDSFWTSLKEKIKHAYKYVTGSQFPKDVPLEHAYIPTIFQTVQKELNSPDFRDKSGHKDWKEWKGFLIRFTDPGFNENLQRLYLEFSGIERRIRWLKGVEGIINFLTIAVMTIVFLCLISPVLLIHGNLLWSYVLALQTIILFMYSAWRAIVLAKQSSAISLRKEIPSLLGCLLVSFFIMWVVYIGPCVVPQISRSIGDQRAELNAFKGDKSVIPSFLKKLVPKPSKKEVLQESEEPSKDANSTSDGSNEKMDPTEGGPAKIKGVDTGHEDYKANEKSPSNKAPLKVNDVLDPDLLTKSKNKGKDLNHKNAPTNLDQQ